MEILLTILTSGAVATIITKVIDVIAEKRKGQSLLEKAVMSLLGITIRTNCESAIKKKGISVENLKQLEEMNAIYKTMGGNGFVKTLMDKVSKLPIIAE